MGCGGSTAGTEGSKPPAADQNHHQPSGDAEKAPVQEVNHDEVKKSPTPVVEKEQPPPPTTESPKKVEPEKPQVIEEPVKEPEKDPEPLENGEKEPIVDTGVSKLVHLCLYYMFVLHVNHMLY